MCYISLVPETIIQTDGAGPLTELDSSKGRLYVLTLEITRAVEQESLEVEVWGSPDGANWGDKPVATLPQKFYCGVYSTLVNLARRPEIKYLRLKWRTKRWSKGDTTPLFAFSSFLEESGARLKAAVA